MTSNSIRVTRWWVASNANGLPVTYYEWPTTNYEWPRMISSDQWLITSHQRLITSVHEWLRVTNDWLRVTAINFECSRLSTNDHEWSGMTNLKLSFKSDHVSNLFVTMSKLLFCDECPCHSRSLLVVKTPCTVVQRVYNTLGKGGAPI